MKIHKDLTIENKKLNDIVTSIKKNPDKNFFLEAYDKALIIELIANNLKRSETIKFKIDEKTSNYPNILSDELPRFIIQKDVEKEKILLIDYLKDFIDFDFKIEKTASSFFLSITKKTDNLLDLKLKIDTDKTIDLNLLTDKKNKDNIFFGKKSYYYVKK